MIEMDIEGLQSWVNSKIIENSLDIKLLEVDGVWGIISRMTFIQIFINKGAKKISKEELACIVSDLGDIDSDRIEAISEVESRGSGWTVSGLPVILYERHYFHRLTNIVMNISGLGWIGRGDWGGYSLDINNNDIDDSWEKLSYAVGKDVISACSSVSIGKFQVMGIYYKELGYSSPLDMLWDSRNGEYSHYKMLVGYIMNVAHILPFFLSLSIRAEDNIPFVRAYNGRYYYKNKYHIKIANVLKRLRLRRDGG